MADPNYIIPRLNGDPSSAVSEDQPNTYLNGLTTT
jgi:hypothetical protein